MMTDSTLTAPAPVRDVVASMLAPRRVEVRFQPTDANLAAFKTHVHARKYYEEGRAWRVPLSPASLLGIAQAFPYRVQWGSELAPHIRDAQAWARFAKAVTTAVDETGTVVTDHAALAAAGALDLPARPGKLPLWRHQPLAYNFARVMRRSLLWMGMATGKSCVVINVAANIGGPTGNGPAQRVLIVAPKAMIIDKRTGWAKEFATHSPDDYVIEHGGTGTIEARIARMKKAMIDADIQGRPFCALVNYAAFWRPEMLEFIQKERVGVGPTSKVQPRWWDLVVFDESQALKGHDSNQSKMAAVIADAQHVGHVIELSGTPMSQSPGDIFGQMRVIDPAIFGDSYSRFVDRHAKLGGYKDHKITAWPGADEILRRTLTRAFHVSSKVLDLPPKSDIIRPFELETAPIIKGAESPRKLYDQLEKKMYLDLYGDESAVVAPANAAVKMIRLSQFTGGWMEVEGALVNISRAKEAALEELLTEIEPEEPVVIFCQFKSDLAAVHEVCKRVGRTSCELSGSKSQHGDWTEGKFNTIAIQIQAGGAGIECTRARYCVYYSINWSLGQWLQSRARVHRPSQTRPVAYFHLTALGTIDELLNRRLIERAATINEASPSEVETFTRAALDEWRTGVKARR